MIMGMQTVWVFGDTADILRLPKPQVKGYLTYGGGEFLFFPSFSFFFGFVGRWRLLMGLVCIGAYGNVTHDPEMVHWDEGY
jgi:hypothetical protein